MKSKLISNSIFYSAIGFFPVAISFFTLPIITRHVPPTDYGILTMVVAFTNLVSVIVSGQMESGVARIYFDYDSEKRKAYFSTLFYTTSGIACAVLIFFLFFGDVFIHILYSKNDIKFTPYFLLSVINMLFSMPVGITTAFFKVQEKVKDLLIISLIATAISTSLIIYFVAVKHMGLVGYFLGMIIGSFVTYLIHVMYFRTNLIFKFETAMLLENLHFSLPVIPHALGGYLFMYSDIIILEKYVAIAVIGVYSIANKFAMLLKMITNAFGSAFSPIFMQTSKNSIKDGQNAVYDISKGWLIVLAISYIILCHAGEYIIYMMTPTSYHEAVFLLPILAMAYVFRGLYIMPINTFYFMKKTKYLLVATLSSGILNIILNILFIPYLGVWGAAITTMISFSINWIVLETLSKKTFQVHFEKKSVVFLFSCIIVSNCVFYFIPHSNFYLRLTVQLVFISSTLLFVYRKNLSNILDLLNRLKAKSRARKED